MTVIRKRCSKLTNPDSLVSCPDTVSRREARAGGARDYGYPAGRHETKPDQPHASPVLISQVPIHRPPPVFDFYKCSGRCSLAKPDSHMKSGRVYIALRGYGRWVRWVFVCMQSQIKSSFSCCLAYCHGSAVSSPDSNLDAAAAECLHRYILFFLFVTAFGRK